MRARGNAEGTADPQDPGSTSLAPGVIRGSLSEGEAIGGRVQRTAGVQFPFLAKFLNDNLQTRAKELAAKADSAGSAETHLGRQESVDSADRQVGRGLRTLDLRALPRDDGPPTELQARRDKFAFFEKLCSEVAPGVCVAGEAVARDRALLRQAGVTHIVNCVGMLCPACFPDDFKYLTLHLNDATGEDLVSLFYDVFAFIEEAIDSGGKALVHCSQGVSRSATFVIAYLMWKHNQPYEKAYQTVKAVRGVANPNIGFTCQLLNWMKRRSAPAKTAKLYQIVPHSTEEKFPEHLVARMLKGEVSLADESRVLLIQLPAAVFIWEGKQAREGHVPAAWKASIALQRFENAPSAKLVHQGEEPDHLLAALGLPTTAGAPEACPPQKWQMSLPVVPKVKLPLSSAASGAVEAAASPTSARTKTPRSENSFRAAGMRSPNQRQRKVRRSDSQSEGPATARSRSSESVDDADDAGLEPGTPLELPRGFSPSKRTPRGTPRAAAAQSPGALRSPLAASSLGQSPRTVH